MTIFLETKRLLIRESSQDNFENVFALFSDAAVMRYVGRGVMTREEAHEKLEKMIQHQKEHGFAFGDVYEKESSLYIGRAGLIYLEMNDKQPEVEVGYLLHKEFWHKGYATELAQALINWGFKHLKLKKITAVLQHENEASRRVLEKSHMRYIGKAFHYDTEVAKYEILNNKVDPNFIKWSEASIDAYPVIQNMGRFYAYDMSQYLGGELGWEMPKNGLYECIDFKKYWEDKNSFPFLIHYKDELAGFIIVDKNSTATHINFNMAQFFVLRKFKRQDMGRILAEQCFDRFRGTWEIGVMSGNEEAYRFWRTVIKKYTRGQFLEYTRQHGQSEAIKNFFELKSR